MTGRFWEVVDSTEFPILVTQGVAGWPRSRPMTLLLREGATLWFATSRRSGKVEEIRIDPRVTVLFVRDGRLSQAALYGRATVVDRSDIKRRLWHEVWTEDWPGGASDPDYVLIRIDGECGSYYPADTGVEERIEL
jgi:general stress protein 26